MNFAFTEEQEFLRSEVRKLLDAQCDVKQVREIAGTSEGYSRDLWQQIGELGWIGLAIPEAHGGGGLGWEELVILFEETGRSLFPSPLPSPAPCAETTARPGNAAQKHPRPPGPARRTRPPSVTRRGTDSIGAMVMSAVSSVRTPGVLVTTMPRSRAAL